MSSLPLDLPKSQKGKTELVEVLKRWQMLVLSFSPLLWKLSEGRSWKVASGRLVDLGCSSGGLGGSIRPRGSRGTHTGMSSATESSKQETLKFLDLKLAMEVSPLVSQETSNDVKTMLVASTWLSRTPVKPLRMYRIKKLFQPPCHLYQLPCWEPGPGVVMPIVRTSQPRSSVRVP